MKPIKLVNSYVYVVLEYHSENTGPRVHDVFINEQEAQGKKESLTLPTKTTNYVAVLKKPLRGKERDAGNFFTENLKKVLMGLK